MLAKKSQYKRAPVQRDKNHLALIPHKSKTIPDQSYSIAELMRRFVKGVPAAAGHNQPIYNSDNNELDMESLSRLDPADRAFYAQEMRAQNEATASAIKRMNDEATRNEEEQKQAEADQREQQTGIGSLDNTMPDDTGSDSQSVTRGKKSNKK